ncbi:MAG TPA: alpha-1,4-glucan--maltose-1-phosphate maltosyltransferase [Rhizomicrobium sp.]
MPLRRGDSSSCRQAVREPEPPAANVERAHRRLARATDPSERIWVGRIDPSVDRGAYTVKRTIGDSLRVEADIVADGHTSLAAVTVIRHEREKSWRRLPMTPIGNDRWRSETVLAEKGYHRFAVEAWIDVYGGFARGLEKKRLAGTALSLDLDEGCALIAEARENSQGHVRAALDAILSGLQSLPDNERLRLLLAKETIAAMAVADTRPFLARSFVQNVDVERKQASFASWYELFPRSETSNPTRHGTFRDVMARLPEIAAMGFDVLYFPPIHPIGLTNRKGRNNAPRAQPSDPGSVYAIGSSDGGHDSIHRQLGTLGDFHALIAAARGHGIEIALDFAIQCSPDHPWLSQHPDWFDWRADGSIHFAENPPKTYEDIVNVDFYTPGATPGLWLALRDIVLFWMGHGVRLFRVDNPHTKPLPFWEWLIADIRARDPDVVFLAEAFTRPKMMFRLAKVGFNQSYTYFTWRNTKHELTEYLTELSTTSVREYFRPHFFVNTPDINPVFVQSGARAAFLIRSVLAATLSGLWGLYSGFELCEYEPLPGREEYRDSEKYEIKPRDWNKPGHIKAEIAALNALRRREPALQSHLGVAFYNAFNDQTLYYAKTAPGREDRVIVIVNLDAHAAQECDFELPLWEWNIPDHGSLAVEDLLHGHRFVWTGKIQHVRLEPAAPYRIWRIRPCGETPA